MLVAPAFRRTVSLAPKSPTRHPLFVRCVKAKSKPAGTSTIDIYAQRYQPPDGDAPEDWTGFQPTGWQDVESYDAGQDTTDPVTLYADAIAYTGESQTAFQVQFRIENYASSLMTSTVHSVRVDNVAPSGSIEIDDGEAGRTVPA